MIRNSLFPARRVILLITLVALALVAGTAVAQGPKGSTSSGDSVGYTAIAGSPLTINVAVDASYQIIHDAVDPGTPGQVYPTSQPEADAGIFLWYGDFVMGPDFDNHDISASNSYDAWTNVSQSAVIGSGTAGDPWRVETQVEHAASGVNLTTTTYYVNGDDYLRIDWQVCVPQTGAISTFLAADLYLQGSDDGYGYYDATTGSVGGYNQAQDWYQIFTPITPASAYYEEFYGTIWDAIGSAGAPGTGFPSTISADYIDNGAGLQWNQSALTGCADFSSYWSFGTTPTPPPTAVSLSSFGAQPGTRYGLVLAAGLLAAGGLFVLRRRRAA